MPIYSAHKKTKLYIGNKKVKAAYLGATKVYSSGNIVTYKVDTNTTYTEEVEEGASCLLPKTFTPTKSGWTFVGWRSDAAANANVYMSYIMGDNPVTLYAVFKQTVTLTTVANSVTSKQNKDRLYNNVNITNPVFTVTNPSKNGATFLGWSSSASSTTVSNSSIANLSLSDSATRYAVFKYADATETSGNGTYTTTSSKTMTLYELDTTKYESHTVTAAVTRLLTSNNTAGRIDNYVYVDSRLARQTSAHVDGTTTNEIGNPIGANGRDFTITYAGDLTAKFNLSGYGYMGNGWCAELTVKSLILNGKTTVG